MGVAAKTYRNCTALNKDYKHGVGQWGATDHTSGTNVTTCKRSNRLYNANDHLDWDMDKDRLREALTQQATDHHAAPGVFLVCR